MNSDSRGHENNGVKDPFTKHTLVMSLVKSDDSIKMELTLGFFL